MEQEEERYKLEIALGIDPELNESPPLEFDVLIKKVKERVLNQDELRAIIVDLLEFMDREVPGSEGYYYEIKRRAQLIRKFIPNNDRRSDNYKGEDITGE